MVLHLKMCVTTSVCKDVFICTLWDLYTIFYIVSKRKHNDQFILKGLKNVFTFEVATCRPIIWQLQSSDFDIFNLFDTDDIELSQLCEKMDTENNLINTADIFRKGLTFLTVVRYLFIFQLKIFPSSFVSFGRASSKLITFQFVMLVPPPSPFPGQTYMYCFYPVCQYVTVTNFVSTVSSVPLLHVPCILDTSLAPYKHGPDLLSVPLLHVPCFLDTWLAPYKHGHDLLSVLLLHVPRYM
jgi:hypothetical protein